MTLLLTTEGATVPDVTPSPVAALVLSGRTPDDLSALLADVAAQSLRVDRVILLDRTPGGIPAAALEAAGDAAVEVRAAAGLSWREAVHAAARDLLPAVPREATDDGSTPDDWLLWVLPVGTRPAPDALARLVRAHRRSASVGMIGPKLLDARDPSRLRSVGICATRSGLLVDDPADGTPDQGQYDQRHDVIAVPLAGALVEASLVRSLRGWAASFGDVAGDLDFGWRAQRAGRRVLVLPTATVRATPEHGIATATTPARRRAARRVALTRTSWWAVPLRALWLVVSALLSALALLLLKRPRGALAALGDVLAVNPLGLVRARWRTRSPASVRRADLDGLFVSPAEIRRRIADRVHEALMPGSTTEEAPPEHRRSTAVRLLTHPGLIAVLAVTAAYAAAGRRLGPGFLAGLAGGPQGGELLGGRVSSAALWHAWRGPWRGAGLGSDDLVAGPHLALLAAPTWLVEHLPGLGGVASPAGLVVGLLILLGPAAATISAYVSTRVLTRHRWLRAAVALSWAATGVAATGYAQGRLGAMLAHVLLPALLAGFVLLARGDGTATAGWATALTAGVLAAFAPATLLLSTALALLVLVAAPGAGPRLRSLPVLVVPTALLGPWLLDVWHDPRLLLAGPGLTHWDPPAVPDWHLALLQPAGLDLTRWWWSVPTVLLVLLGVLGLTRGQRPRSLPSGIAATALLSLAGALAASRVLLATVPGPDPDASPHVTPWAGLPLLVLTAALLAGATWWIGAPDGPGRAHRWRTAGTLTLALVAAGSVTALVLPGLDTPLRAWVDPRPAVAIEHADGDAAGRTLFVSPSADSGSAEYRIVAREVGDIARSLPVDRDDDRALAPAVSALLAGGEDAGTTMAQHAISIIALTETAAPELARTLDAAEGLTRLAGRHGWDYWRVTAVGAQGGAPVTPARLVLHGQDGIDPLTTTGQHAATETSLDAGPGARLVVAEPVAWARHATVRWQGHVVPADTSQDRPAYALAPGPGTLSIELTDPHETWRLAQGILLGVVVFLAIPFGSRASRRTR